MDTLSIVSRPSRLLLVLCMALAFSVTIGKSTAQNSALLWVVPIEEGVYPTGNPKLAIRVDNASQLYGAEVHLGFSPTALAVVDANERLPGVQISSGFCPKPGFVARNRAENQDGTIEYILTQLNPQAPCDNGIVAIIEFQCLAPGKHPLRITSSLLLALGAEVIPHTTQNGIVNCQAPRPTYQLYFPILRQDFTAQAYLPLIMHNQRNTLSYLPLIMHHKRADAASLPAKEEKQQLTTERHEHIWSRIIRFVNALRIPESWRK